MRVMVVLSVNAIYRQSSWPDCDTSVTGENSSRFEAVGIATILGTHHQLQRPGTIPTKGVAGIVGLDGIGLRRRERLSMGPPARGQFREGSDEKGAPSFALFTKGGYRCLQF